MKVSPGSRCPIPPRLATLSSIVSRSQPLTVPPPPKLLLPPAPLQVEPIHDQGFPRPRHAASAAFCCRWTQFSSCSMPSSSPTLHRPQTRKGVHPCSEPPGFCHTSVAPPPPCDVFKLRLLRAARRAARSAPIGGNGRRTCSSCGFLNIT